MPTLIAFCDLTAANSPPCVEVVRLVEVDAALSVDDHPVSNDVIAVGERVGARCGLGEIRPWLAAGWARRSAWLRTRHRQAGQIRRSWFRFLLSGSCDDRRQGPPHGPTRTRRYGLPNDVTAPVVAKPAIACQSSVFSARLDEAFKLARVWLGSGAAPFADTQKKRAAQPHAPPNCAHTLTPA